MILATRRHLDMSGVTLAVIFAAMGSVSCSVPSTRVVYYLHTVPATWSAARSMCESYSAVLICLADVNTTTASVRYVDTKTWGGQLAAAQQKGLWTGLYRKSDNTTLWHGCTPSLRSPDNQFCYKAGADFTLFPADCNEELQYICQLNDGQCWFQPWSNHKVDDSSALVNSTTTDDESACAKLCRDNMKNDQECWAFSFTESTKHCVLYFTNENHKYALTNRYFVNETGTTVYEKICTGGWTSALSAPNSINGNPLDENCTSGASGDAWDSSICYCECSQPPVILTAEDLVKTDDEKAEEIQKELYVDPDNTSSTRRKKISVEDNRPSAQSIGYVGVVIMAVVFGGIILLDLPVLISHGKDLVVRLHKMCTRSKTPQK
ncbi:uncharacterized protein LOC112559803 [Pomacea canaliculata]|uniref:uncharacterized protein LOC112559803 n=1 Tax=Pomacea canaliculata TaxID=400727 RepID=UPI000D725F10|nr:uncharacterized protein LOC112559803 [Pomacea canaliculata]XP_025087010.1 uncharacterized protein LOC112559803 [Pomacea canaliculata]